MIWAALVIGAELAVACLVGAAVLLIADHWHRDILDALDRIEYLLDHEAARQPRSMTDDD